LYGSEDSYFLDIFYARMAVLSKNIENDTPRDVVRKVHKGVTCIQYAILFRGM
jgi:hypothetical protein